MNVLEKAEKALDFLKNNEGSTKSHELQTAAGTLGRCLGALGGRQSYARHYANLLHAAIPTLLSLASNDSAEVRLVGDETLNRAVVGGYAFHAYKTNVILQNQIDSTKNARWIRAALTRICLGECWLRPGPGKIRVQAQTLFPKLALIIRQTNEIQLIVEALENNLPRILKALAEYSIDEEIFDVFKALCHHVESNDPPVRRGAAACIAHLVAHRETLITQLIATVFEKLWPVSSDSSVIQGWFGVIKSIFQINKITFFTENDNFTLQDYLELYQLCIQYIENTATDHNIQNAVLECLTVLLSQANGDFKRALLEKHPIIITLDNRQREKTHRRNISSLSAITSIYSLGPLDDISSHEPTELRFSGALHLGSLSQLQTPMLSVEDLSIQTPDSPASDVNREVHAEVLTKDLTEKLEEIQEKECKDEDHIDRPSPEPVKINIGSNTDEDIPLKYCARLLASKYILTGNKGGLIPDRTVRVSVKSSALSCLSEIIQHYPQAMTMYLNKDVDAKGHNISGSSEGTIDSTNQDNINDFILERNVCYQDSLTDSLSQELLLHKSTDSHTSQSRVHSFKKDSKSTESVEQKSSKDIPSNILDSKNYPKNELMTSNMTDSTNPNMTISNFTSNSNMTGSNDPMSTGYPMTSSGDVLSSSVDLDMKFDHFGESTTNLENLDALKDLNKTDDLDIHKKRVLKRTEAVQSKDTPELGVDKNVDSKDTDDTKESKDTTDSKDDSDFEFQHLSEIFILLEGHNDPQIRGVVRVCMGNYVSAALDLSHGDYYRWRNYSMLPKEITENITTDKLVEIVLKGLSDEIHSCVNHTLLALIKIINALASSSHSILLPDILNSLVVVQNNNYWLCKVSLCKLYMKIPYQRLFVLFPVYTYKNGFVMDTLFKLLADQDQKVRNAAATAITSIIPVIYPLKKNTPTLSVTEMAKEHSEHFNFDYKGLSLDLVKSSYFYSDLPDQLKDGERVKNIESLKMVLTQLVSSFMASSGKHYAQGLLETLHIVCKSWQPWLHIEAYLHQDMMALCLDHLECCNNTIPMRTILLDLCTLLYPVEVSNVMSNRQSHRGIFERDTENGNAKWHHLDSEKCANLAEKFLQVTLKMLNILVHLIEEVNPNVHWNKTGIALPGSPVRRKTHDSLPRKNSNASESLDEKGSLRKKPQVLAGSLRSNFQGHFYTEPFYMKLYENLRAAYSNHKINLYPKTSMFYEFVSTVLDALAIQLELGTEREFGCITEEILYYLKVIMPLRADKTVFCITQLLKCLFGTNMSNQYADFMSIDNSEVKNSTSGFFDSVMMVNSFTGLMKEEVESNSRRSSATSGASLKLIDSNPRMSIERRMLIKLENFAKNKSDKKWSTNKKELERYIRLFEPVVIQALKSYTMQNDIPLQCKVLSLLNQLLTLRVNYCMLDSEQIFIGFLLKQLEMVEQHEIPDCCELVNHILMFLVQLSSSKHHTKQIIEVPKLIQLCDGLMASGAHAECISAIQPLSIKVFWSVSSSPTLGRAQQQELQVTKEVVFYMLQKTMHDPKVLDLVACLLALSQEHPESYYSWSELACDTLLNLLSQRSLEVDTAEAISCLEKLIDSVYKDVLLEQSRVELLLKILFKAPPDQNTTPYKLRLRYLSITMVLLRKILVYIPETEILLSINYLKASYISPQSIFFNVKTDIDPLNVQNVNENCVNLSPDVILVRFLFKTLTYAILEIDKCNDVDCADLNLECDDNNDGHRLLYRVCVNLICQVKHMLHLKNGCLFPLTSKTAQNILHNEQSGLNTGLYSPEENIPLDILNLICLRCAHRIPLLTVHWSHLLIRLKFLEQKYWQKLLGFVRNLPLSPNSGNKSLLQINVLEIGCFLAYCEYFVDNGLSEVIHLTWLLANRIHILVSYYKEPIVRALVDRVQKSPSASGLLMQAVGARCQHCLKDEFALNTYKILSSCHESQSGALIFLICRIMAKLDPTIGIRFAKLAIERCRLLKDLPIDKINLQLSKEDVQVAMEMLQRDKVYLKYPSLVLELNALASSVFDLSPLDLSQDRAINPQYIVTTTVDGHWLVNQIKGRCCQTACNAAPKISQQKELALLLAKLSPEDLNAVISCQEFDRRILNSCFRVACDMYLKEFLNVLSAYETKELQKEEFKRQNYEPEEKVSNDTIDSNILNVANTLHVFKKSDSKESKSQFFIPMTDNKEMSNLKEKYGNLKICEDEDNEIVPPELPNLYTTSLANLDKCLADTIRLFPKQSRPLSQSENFNLTKEQTIDRYTKRCHQVFQDKLFYQEFCIIQNILKSFLDSLHRLYEFLDEIDCEISEKILENILPSSLAKNIAIFTVISLQYLSFLIKNKKIVESPIHADVSFRVTTVSEKVIVDNAIVVALNNSSKALSFAEIWNELNVDSNINRIQSAISCLYAITKYLVKDTKPLIFKNYIRTAKAPKSDLILTSDKLLTLIEYWEGNFYAKALSKNNNILGESYRIPIESLVISLSRLDLVCKVALIPPIAWSTVDLSAHKDYSQKIDIPLQALQDMDVLEAFLFRVNFVGWSTKKAFEEIWVGMLGALQGNGTHWAVRGIMQLLISTIPKVRKGHGVTLMHIPRKYEDVSDGVQKLRNILVGSELYETLFDNVNFERIPFRGDAMLQYHYGQFNTDYLRLASEITDDATFRVKLHLKRMKRSTDIDVNSCLQLLMDVATQMLQPKAPTGLSARCWLLSCVITVSDLFTEIGQWCWLAQQLIALTTSEHKLVTQYSIASQYLMYGLSKSLSILEGFDGLSELSTVHQKLLKSLTSSYAPLRQAALQGCLLQLCSKARRYARAQTPNPYHELVSQLDSTVRQYLAQQNRISLYEQSLYWTVLFTLIEMGHSDLITIAVDFLLTDPDHFCSDLIVKGITSTIRLQILPKELKNTIIEKLITNMKNYRESHALLILMVHLFTADNKLLSPKLASDVSNMDPDILMNSMERLTLLYRLLREATCHKSQLVIAETLKYFLRETLPPAATLSRVIIEFLEACKEAERIEAGILTDKSRWILRSVVNADVVFEVFETSIAQHQMPVLSGWIFEALGHLLSGKISADLLPYCLTGLLVSASTNTFIRNLSPLTLTILKAGLTVCSRKSKLSELLNCSTPQSVKMSFADRRLLCVVALHSGFNKNQLDKLMELCNSDVVRFEDLSNCLMAV